MDDLNGAEFIYREQSLTQLAEISLRLQVIRETIVLSCKQTDSILMDRQAGRQTDRQHTKQTDRQHTKQTDRQTDRQTDSILMDKQTDRQTDRQHTNRQTDGRTDGQTLYTQVYNKTTHRSHQHIAYIFAFITNRMQQVESVLTCVLLNVRRSTAIGTNHILLKSSRIPAKLIHQHLSLERLLHL